MFNVPKVNVNENRAQKDAKKQKEVAIKESEFDLYGTKKKRYDISCPSMATAEEVLNAINEKGLKKGDLVYMNGNNQIYIDEKNLLEQITTQLEVAKNAR